MATSPLFLSKWEIKVQSRNKFELVYCCWEALSWSHIILGSEMRSEPSWSYWKPQNISYLAKIGQEGQENCEATRDPKCALWPLREHFNTTPWRPRHITASQPVDVYFHHTDTRDRSATCSFNKGMGKELWQNTSDRLGTLGQDKESTRTEMCGPDQTKCWVGSLPAALW